MSHCLKMGSAMMKLTMLTVTLMAESAALTSTRITVQIALVFIKKTVLLALLPLLLEMVSVMTRPTLLTVIMMAEIAVSQKVQISKMK
jgi:hypothetical protein